MWHFNLVSDPAKHSYKETLVSLLWCWEVRRCMHCPWQLLVPGKVITPHEVTDMSEHLQHCAARQKLERVAAFRQLQGYSNQLRVMTSGRDPPGSEPVTLASFKLPEEFCLRPVAQDERRGTMVGEQEDVSFIVNTVTKSMTRILPMNRTKVCPGAGPRGDNPLPNYCGP